MSCYDISKEKVDEIRRYLIDNVFRSPSIMFDDNIRGYDDDDMDLIAIICDLYEYIHVLVYGKNMTICSTGQINVALGLKLESSTH